MVISEYSNGENCHFTHTLGIGGFYYCSGLFSLFLGLKGTECLINAVTGEVGTSQEHVR
jgi:hypothetical protein